MTIMTFTIWYTIDSTGIRQHSLVSKKEIRWEEVIWISPDDGAASLSSATSIASSSLQISIAACPTLRLT